MIRLNRFLLIYLLTAVVGVLTARANAEDAAARQLEPIPAAQADTIATVLDELLGAVDRNQFDLQARLDALDFDENEIISFVSSQIAYEAYPGLLRGAEGTLVSRAGNSLDQSVLLAHLLKEAGFDARIAQGSAPQSLLRTALQQPRSPDRSAFAEPEVLVGLSARLSGSTEEPRALSDDEKGRIQNASVLLPDSLTRLSEQIQKEVRDTDITSVEGGAAKAGSEPTYFWVEYRDGPASPWQATHPALAGQTPDQLTADAYLADHVDPSLQQRISVQAFIDRVRGGKLETLPVTARIELPTASLSGHTFSYSVIPSAFLAAEGSTADQGEELLAASTLFFPVFDFGEGTLDQAFDLNGSIVSADVAASSMAPLFQTVGSRFLSAGDAIGSNSTSSEEASSTNHVTRHWIELTIHRPGLDPKVITRDIALWQGDADRFRQSLARSAYFRVETGHVSPAKFLDRNLRAQRAILSSLASANPLGMDKGLIAQFSNDAEVFLLTSDAVAAQNEAIVSYRAEPTIVARYFPYGRLDVDLEGFDIMNAPRYAISRSDSMPDPNATMFSGIADTWIEHELFAGTDWSHSAYGRLAQRLTAGGALTVLNSRAQPAFESLPADAKANVEKDLQHNQLVVLSGAPTACDAWWRVDPTSGETLGMLSNGWGGSMMGYLRDLAAVHGKVKIASIATGCGLVVPFITASAAINAAGLFQLDEALGMQGMDLCSQVPPNLQVLCTATVTAASMAAATGAGESGLSGGVLMRICVMSAL